STLVSVVAWTVVPSARRTSTVVVTRGTCPVSSSSASAARAATETVDADSDRPTWAFAGVGNHVASHSTVTASRNAAVARCALFVVHPTSHTFHPPVVPRDRKGRAPGPPLSFRTRVRAV